MGEWCEIQTGQRPWNGCHQNFIEGITKIGVADGQFPQNDLNVFQPTKYARNEAGFTVGALGAATNLKMGSFVEFYAEMDMYVVVSNCPVGDQGKHISEVDCWPVGMEIHDTGVAPVMDFSGFRYAPWHADFMKTKAKS